MSGRRSRTVAINVEVGEHIEWHVFGVTLNVDTILGTLVAGAIIIMLGLLMRAQSSATQADADCSCSARRSPARSSDQVEEHDGRADRAVRGAAGDRRCSCSS